VELVSAGGDGKSLFEELRRNVLGGKVCYPRSALVSPPQAWADVELSSPVLYETAPRPFDRSVIDRVDVVAVASPSAVEAVGRVDLPFASIGPSTSDALRRLGIEPWVEAAERSFDSLAETIAAQGSESRHHPA
jgi:uroporphyrinogen-III synthase